MQIIIIVMQLHNTNAAACVEHVSIQATGQCVSINVSIAAVVHLPKITPVAVLHGGQINVGLYIFFCYFILFVSFKISYLITFTEIFGLTNTQ